MVRLRGEVKRLASSKLIMPLYTFFLDYKGGTYISQIRAASPSKATEAWARKLKRMTIQGMGDKSKERLAQELSDEVPIPIDGLERTWCSTALIQGQLVLINLVETAE
jgi:hypothetical protein